MFTIRQASELTGVAEHTLRAWERRYGAVVPTRTPGGYRMYDESAITQIRAMKSLVDAGIPPREAALETLGRAGETRSGSEATQRLVEAAARLDPTSVGRIIDEQFGLRSYEAAVDDWLMPSLVRIGSAWADGRISVAGEHLVANIVMRRLAAAYDAAGPNAATAPVIIGAPTGVEHELGLFAFAVALRRTGTATVYLGSQVPPSAWSDAVHTTGAVASVTALSRRADGRRIEALVERLRADHPTQMLAVGGRFQRLAPPACQQLGHSITPAAESLARQLRGLPETPERHSA